MPSPTDPADSSQPPSFESSLAELADAVVKLESGSLGLSESIAAYEHGVTLLRRLYDELAVAEQKVATLVRLDENGHPVLVPHDATASDVPPTEAGRSKPRKARSRTLPGMDES